MHYYHNRSESFIMNLMTPKKNLNIFNGLKQIFLHTVIPFDRNTNFFHSVIPLLEFFDEIVTRW